MPKTTRKSSREQDDASDAILPATSAVAGGGGAPEHLVLTAHRDVTIQCGKASITLTAAGKIILRGTHIVSRSSGVQRIKGGSVQIN